jgi:hypothetical protein
MRHLLQRGAKEVDLIMQPAPAKPPSVFALSVVFGGAIGMTAASAFGLNAGGGFIVGASLVFLLLSVGVFISRDIERVAFSQDVLKAIVAGLARKGEATGTTEDLNRSV